MSGMSVPGVVYMIEVVVVGVRGPVRKASEDRIRRNKDESGMSLAKAPRSRRVAKPQADAEWAPVAKRLWRALRKAPHVERFYTETDWAYAYFVMDEITRYVNAERQNGQVLTALSSMLSSLLVVEGDRRRLRIELSAGADEGDGAVESKVVVMNEWRKVAADGL